MRRDVESMVEWREGRCEEEGKGRMKKDYAPSWPWRCPGGGSEEIIPTSYPSPVLLCFVSWWLPARSCSCDQ